MSTDAPVLDSVYKVVAFDGRPVRKTSKGKATWPGPKQVWRCRDEEIDILGLDDEEPPQEADGLLQVVMRDGRRTQAGRADLAAASRRFEEHWHPLPRDVRQLTDPRSWTVRPSPALERLTAQVDARRMDDTEQRQG